VGENKGKLGGFRKKPSRGKYRKKVHGVKKDSRESRESNWGG